MDGSRMSFDVVIGGIDIHARRAEVTVERKRLIEAVGDMQTHVLGQAAVVGVEILVVPLQTAVILPIAVVPTVVGPDRHHILALMHECRDVQSTGHHAVLVLSCQLSIHPHIGPLTEALELEEHLPRTHALQAEAFAIPSDIGRQRRDITGEGLMPIERPRQGHRLPRGIIIIDSLCRGVIAHMQTPVAIEVLGYAFASRHANGQHQQQSEHQHATDAPQQIPCSVHHRIIFVYFSINILFVYKSTQKNITSCIKMAFCADVNRFFTIFAVVIQLRITIVLLN